mmetsp:Transcript_13676/g.22321  ORF Transcript_13676/g.22321 Transcript_13676/m.22321 type:complete len:266 (-) Transcript_13676:66-863(-)
MRSVGNRFRSQSCQEPSHATLGRSNSSPMSTTSHGALSVQAVHGGSSSPASPRIFPQRVAPRLTSRNRALSECGRQLFLEMYGGHEGDLGLLRPEEHRVQPKPRVTKKPLSPTNPKYNYWAEIDSDSDDENEVAFRNLKTMNEDKLGNARLVSPRGGRPNVPVRIDESVLGETEGEIEGWETVSSAKKKRQQRPKRVARKASSPKAEAIQNRAYSYSSDYDDLYDLQARTFGGRQVGSAKKPMQHKAMEKRGYAIEKRNQQRGRR